MTAALAEQPPAIHPHQQPRLEPVAAFEPPMDPTWADRVGGGATASGTSGGAARLLLVSSRPAPETGRRDPIAIGPRPAPHPALSSTPPSGPPSGPAAAPMPVPPFGEPAPDRQAIPTQRSREVIGAAAARWHRASRTEISYLRRPNGFQHGPASASPIATMASAGSAARLDAHSRRPVIHSISGTVCAEPDEEWDDEVPGGPGGSPAAGISSASTRAPGRDAHRDGTTATTPGVRATDALVQAVLEVLSGQRTMEQLRNYCAFGVYAELGDLPALGGHARLLSHYACVSGLDRIDISAAFRCGPRVRALALRLQRHRGRWLISAIQFA